MYLHSVKYTFFFALLAGCSFIPKQAVDDFIEGEAQTIEKVADDFYEAPGVPAAGRQP